MQPCACYKFRISPQFVRKPLSTHTTQEIFDFPCDPWNQPCHPKYFSTLLYLGRDDAPLPR